MSSPKQLIVIHVITGLGMGGAERFLANLVLNMDRATTRNVVISLSDLDYWGLTLRQHGIEVHALNIQSPWRVVAGLIKLMRLLRKIQPDVVQCWMYHANVLGLIAAKLAGVKRVYWNIRCSLMDLAHYGFGTTVVFKLGAWLSRVPTGIICNSQSSIAQHTAKGYRNKNWLYIPNGFDLELFKPSPELYRKFRLEHHLPENAILIGMVARYDPMKDHATFLRAAGLLARELDNVYFVCAGKNVSLDNSAISAVINETNLHSRVLLLDQVNNVHELYPALDYLSVTSIFGEGFPNVVAEAMACGVPCFVTDVGDALAIVNDPAQAIPTQDPLELRKKWRQEIDNNHDKQARKNAARQRIVHEFSLQKITALYDDLYRTAT